MTGAAQALGFWGKLPSRGDFVGTGLPRAFVGRWDAWLQPALHAAQGLAGDAWEEIWAAAPPWRFLLPAGPCGSAALGVLVASRDRVGRRFPLTVAALYDPHPPDVSAAWPWLVAAEAAAVAARDMAAAPDWLAARLPPPPQAGGAEPGAGLWWRGDAAAGRPVVLAGMLPSPSAFASMLGGCVATEAQE